MVPLDSLAPATSTREDRTHAIQGRSGGVQRPEARASVEMLGRELVELSPRVTDPESRGDHEDDDADHDEDRRERDPDDAERDAQRVPDRQEGRPGEMHLLADGR